MYIVLVAELNPTSFTVFIMTSKRICYLCTSHLWFNFMLISWFLSQRNNTTIINKFNKLSMQISSLNSKLVQDGCTNGILLYCQCLHVSFYLFVIKEFLKSEFAMSETTVIWSTSLLDFCLVITRLYGDRCALFASFFSWRDSYECAIPVLSTPASLDSY